MMIMIAAAALAAAQPAPPAPDMGAQHGAMGQMDNMPAAKHAMKEKCCCDDMDKGHDKAADGGMHHG
jgi:hypothetical protein